jgi:cytochrome c oxidase subunit 4
MAEQGVVVEQGAKADEHDAGQQHPIGIYIKIWILLFVLSTFSYMVDYYHLEGYLRWTLIIIFMLLKAGFIMAIFMHLAWERLAMVLLIILPPSAILVLIALMAIEADYTFFTRLSFFS